MCSILGWCGKGGSEEKVKEALSKTISRGPDDSRIINTGNGWLGFNRLSIMGPAPEGMQPFDTEITKRLTEADARAVQKYLWYATARYTASEK